MCIDYRMTCTACGTKWNIVSEGVYYYELKDGIHKCSECGCEKIEVEDTNKSEHRISIIDFTETNAEVLERITPKPDPYREQKFASMQEGFRRLAWMHPDTLEYTELKQWLMDRICMNAFDRDPTKL